MSEDHIQPMRSSFEEIKKEAPNGEAYWTSRELSVAMGYTTYYRFAGILPKAIAMARDRGLPTDDHFYVVVEMVKLGSGAYRKVENYHLSQTACQLLAACADGRKEGVIQAREYFSLSRGSSQPIEEQRGSHILFYKSEQGETKVEVVFNDETFWLSQKKMAALYGVEIPTINYHLKQIYASGELKTEATIRKILMVQQEGGRSVERNSLFYNLDAIIAVGYRVNSYQATQFRIWATQVLKDFIIKGFVLDDERLKQGRHFDRDYFDDLLERIREIRTSERRYYQKITDVYAECSADYDPRAATSQQFFKMVQNMMHWAVTHHTAAEIIYHRADADQPHMGLTTWKKAPEGRVQKSDTIVAKNYLSDKELAQLNRLSSAFLDFAELRAEQHIVTTMEEWKNKLATFLAMSDYEVLEHAGTVSKEQAQEKAFGEYEKYKLIQDREYLSDFDKEMKRLQELGLLKE